MAARPSNPSHALLACRTLILGLGSLTLLGGCSDNTMQAAGVGAVNITRLDLQPDGSGAGEPPSEALAVHRFQVALDSLDHWDATGAADEVQVQGATRRSGAWMGIHLDDPKGSTVSIPVEIQPNSVNSAAIRLVCKSKVDVSVVLTRKGKEVVKSPFLRHNGEGTPAIVLVDLPGVLSEDEPFDGILVRTHRLGHDAVFLGVDLLYAPLSGFLPSTQDGLQAVGLGNEFRTAVSLARGTPLTATAEVASGGVLRFGYGRPPQVLRASERPVIHVSVFEVPGESDEEHLLCEQDYPLPREKAAQSWADAEMVIPNESPSRVRVLMELRTSFPGESLVAISSPRIERRWAGPATVVLITSDTHRADYLGSSPNSVGVQTPFLDELARRGVMFEDAFSSTNITNPSHASIMTALSPRDTRMVDNNTVLSEEAQTLAEKYQEAGYFTLAALSAGHMNHRQSGLSQGFDRLWVPRGKTDVDSRISIQQLDEWLAEAHGLPLFVWLHIFDAHAPYEVPEELRWKYYDRDPYDENLPALPTAARVPWDAAVRDVEYVVSQYMSEVTYLDSQLEGFLSHPRFQNAIIAITGDHGESFGNHGLYYTHHGLFPETLGVPLILNWPGGPSGVAVQKGVDHLDLGRTLLDLSGMTEVEFPGRNLLRWVEDPQHESEPRFALAAHAHSASIEQDGWYLVLNITAGHKPERVRHQVELYWLPEDPGCARDLVDQEIERARDMRGRLLVWLEDASEKGLSSATGLQSVEELAQLAALGYASGDETGDAGEGGWYRVDPDNEWCRKFE